MMSSVPFKRVTGDSCPNEAVAATFSTALQRLNADLRQQLHAARVPEASQAGVVAALSGTLPVNAKQVGSLLDVF